MPVFYDGPYIRVKRQKLEPFSQKISIIYVWKGSKSTSEAVSISCIVIKKMWRWSISITICSKIYQGIHLYETYSWFWFLTILTKNLVSKYINLPKTSLDFCNIFPTKTHCFHRPYFFDQNFSLSDESYFCFYEKN